MDGHSCICIVVWSDSYDEPSAYSKERLLFTNNAPVLQISEKTKRGPQEEDHQTHISTQECIGYMSTRGFIYNSQNLKVLDEQVGLEETGNGTKHWVGRFGRMESGNCQTTEIVLYDICHGFIPESRESSGQWVNIGNSQSHDLMRAALNSQTSNDNLRRSRSAQTKHF